MDYFRLAQQALGQYQLKDPETTFIRHNENITLKVRDRGTTDMYLLRIHKPVSQGLLGIQHTKEGLDSEVKILRAIDARRIFPVQTPIPNSNGEFVTRIFNEETGKDMYATLLTWIDGKTLSFQEENLDMLAYSIGESVAAFHQFSQDFLPEGTLSRNSYDIDRIDRTIERLKAGVKAEIFSQAEYEMIKEVLALVKVYLHELKLQEGSWGLIHGDIIPGNLIIDNNKVSLIDFCLSGYGFYLFDVGSISSEFEPHLRGFFFEGYASKISFSEGNLKYVEALIFMDIFISYLFFIDDENKNKWIKPHFKELIASCKGFLEGKEVYHSL